MARRVLPLTDSALRKLKVPEGKKSFERRDGNGLLIKVTNTGKKTWYFVYDHPQTKKRQRIKVGEYPAVSLVEARQKALVLRQQVLEGIDPLSRRNREKAALAAQAEAEKSRKTFKEVAELWLENERHNLQPSTFKRKSERLYNHLLPYIGHIPVDEVSREQLIACFKRLDEASKSETLTRVRLIARDILDYAIGYGWASHNIVRDIPRKLFKRVKRRNFPHVRKPQKLREILLAIDGLTQCGYSTKKALQVQPHIFLRPETLVTLRWEYFDWQRGLIDIPEEAMKVIAQDGGDEMRPLFVPMSSWVKSFFLSIYELNGECSTWVFPSKDLKAPIRKETLEKAMRETLQLRGIQTVHGFRSTASTLLNEMQFDRRWIERQLGHFEQSSVEATYNKAEYLPGRTKMMEHWSQWLLRLKEDGNAVPCPIES